MKISAALSLVVIALVVGLLNCAHAQSNSRWRMISYTKVDQTGQRAIATYTDESHIIVCNEFVMNAFEHTSNSSTSCVQLH